MEKEEFIIRAKKLGYTEEVINEIIKNHEQAKNDEIKMSYEIELENLPVSD